MAVIYYPSDQFVLQRTVTSNPSMTEVQLATNPSTFLVFTGSSNYSGSIISASYALNAGGSSGTTLYTGSTYQITASQAISASWANSSLSASWARLTLTASYISGSISFDNLQYPMTASWAIYATTSSNSISSSYAETYTTFVITSSITSSTSASYAETASYAVNGGGGGATTYTTIFTSSANWITCSFSDQKEYLDITLGAVYNFTCSNPVSVGGYANTSLFIHNTSTTTSSLSFPSSWTFIGLKPTFITASKNAYLNLESFGGEIVAGWGSQY